MSVVGRRSGAKSPMPSFTATATAHLGAFPHRAIDVVLNALPGARFGEGLATSCTGMPSKRSTERGHPTDAGTSFDRVAYERVEHPRPSLSMANFRFSDG
jgi:hypothetical protein